MLLAGALLSAPVASEGVTWFESNSPLTQTHKHLLNNDLPAMFSSLVEVWQLESSAALSPHLNDLLVQSFEVDCGKGLGNKEFPDWLKGVLVQRSEIQSPGRDAFRATIEVQSTQGISDISLTRWLIKVSQTITHWNWYEKTSLELLPIQSDTISTTNLRWGFTASILSVKATNLGALG
ncbi:hypothetical protein JCM19238_1644 [Vibrio ponticus]|nr:hypothetical protein JCM19238_1644 [Vibrio ponticus]